MITSVGRENGLENYSVFARDRVCSDSFEEHEGPRRFERVSNCIRNSPIAKTVYSYLFHTTRLNNLNMTILNLVFVNIYRGYRLADTHTIAISDIRIVGFDNFRELHSPATDKMLKYSYVFCCF